MLALLGPMERYVKSFSAAVDREIAALSPDSDAVLF